MSELYIRQSNTGIKGLESKEGEQRRMYSNNAGNCSPSLEFNTNSECSEEDAAIDYLAGILVQAYFDHKENECDISND